MKKRTFKQITSRAPKSGGDDFTKTKSSSMSQRAVLAGHKPAISPLRSDIQMNMKHTHDAPPKSQCAPRVLAKGFTLIELLVVIAIIAILAAILFPVFARARENARRASCQSNQKQIALGIFQYTQDYDEKYPSVYIGPGFTSWAGVTQPYLKSTQIFDCPSGTRRWSGNAGDPFGMSYGLNTLLFEDGTKPVSLSAIQNPTQTVMTSDVGDATTDRVWGRVHPVKFLFGGTAVTGSGQHPSYRHLETTVVAFLDGHVKSMRKDALEKQLGAVSEDGSPILTVNSNDFELWNQY